MGRAKKDETYISLRIPNSLHQRIGWYAEQNGLDIYPAIRTLLTRSTKDVRPPAEPQIVEKLGLFTAAEVDEWKKLCEESGRDPRQMVKKALRGLRTMVHDQ